MVGIPAPSERSVSLRALLPRARFFSTDDLQASGCTCDPERCKPGDILVTGIDDRPPLELAARGMSRGIAGIISEQLLPVPVPQCLVGDSRAALARLCDALADHPSDKLLSIGVVGPHGKTTVSLVTAAVLRGAGLRTAYRCDLGLSDGIVSGMPVAGAVRADHLTGWMRDAVDAGAQAAVCELSDLSLRCHHADAVRLDLLIVTGASPDLPVALDRLRSRGAAIVSADCRSAVRTVLDSGTAMLTYGMRPGADISGKIFRRHPGETQLLVSAGDVTTSLRTKLVGPWMARHQLAAIAAGLLLEQPLHECLSSLGRLSGIPGRLQRVAGMTNPAVVLDSAGSAARLTAALRSLRPETRGRLRCVMEMPADADPGQLAAMGTAAEHYADDVILTIAKRAKPEFLEKAHAVLDGVDAPGRIRLLPDRRRAHRWAWDRSQANDVLLVTTPPPAEAADGGRRVAESDEQYFRRLADPPADETPVLIPHPALLAT